MERSAEVEAMYSRKTEDSLGSNEVNESERREVADEEPGSCPVLKSERTDESEVEGFGDEGDGRIRKGF